MDLRIILENRICKFILPFCDLVVNFWFKEITDVDTIVSFQTLSKVCLTCLCCTTSYLSHQLIAFLVMVGRLIGTLNAF